jgi:hypothetical protein
MKHIKKQYCFEVSKADFSEKYGSIFKSVPVGEAKDLKKNDQRIEFMQTTTD